MGFWAASRGGAGRLFAHEAMVIAHAIMTSHVITRANCFAPRVLISDMPRPSNPTRNARSTEGQLVRGPQKLARQSIDRRI